MKNQIVMVTMSNLEPAEAVGCRVESGGFYGTVRYIGSLPERPGKWYGIEWDDPGRGKHNGTVNGIQYFQTRYPTAGSFVRREKINFGKSIIEAIMTKYGNKENDIMKKIHEQQIVNFQKTIKAPFIEFVGFDKVSTKQGNFESLKIVSVDCQNVSSVGEPNELRSLIPNITSLDISTNLLTTWNDVFQICEQLDKLSSLNVSNNRLTFSEECNYTFPNIKQFICGHMELTWSDIIKLSIIFPCIIDLRANHNHITDLTIEDPKSFEHLKILDLEYNPIGSWDKILELQKITSLQDLSVGGTGIEKIDFKTDKPKFDGFMNLTKLCISENLINDWTSVSELNRLPNLEELRFTKNPILNSEDQETVISIVVAKIGSLKVHNGRILYNSLTGNDFRRECEYDYLKKYGLEWLRVKNTPERDSFLKEHNRYLELVEMYGELQSEELKVEDTSKLKNTLITLNLECGDRKLVKKMVPSMLVQKLRILVQKVFKLNETPELVCITENNFEIPLDDEMKEISYFNVKNNDRILVKI
ncbi:tubulin-specific chaperone E [Anthonomus grandis grandis]|uniref:tubulin-specific chaperone E n=1 Tax=Anthonomus grandis grandis TaxID=2921223 RepID=UPI00216533F9|nr:tubulin-specific chaperone E [Anthonomus grandis grandis]XP_050301037.1 tubulin-specific chaperone E [Anthonomus grandis grandis]XP_050301038.1 tubulin-specific chaperone E [Anthonomus grandis grandis]